MFYTMDISLASITENAPYIFYELRWNGTICCPYCGGTHIYNPNPGQLHICADCHERFSDTSGTIFHSTKLSLSKWLYAIYLFLTSTRGISSYALGRYIQVSQSTAWTMLMKLRSCLARDIQFSCTDQVAIDEVYIGDRMNFFDKFTEVEEVFMHSSKQECVISKESFDKIIAKTTKNYSSAIYDGKLETKNAKYLLEKKVLSSLEKKRLNIYLKQLHIEKMQLVIQ